MSKKKLKKNNDTLLYWNEDLLIYVEEEKFLTNEKTTTTFLKKFFIESLKISVFLAIITSFSLQARAVQKALKKNTKNNIVIQDGDKIIGLRVFKDGIEIPLKSLPSRKLGIKPTAIQSKKINHVKKRTTVNFETPAIDITICVETLLNFLVQNIYNQKKIILPAVEKTEIPVSFNSLFFTILGESIQKLNMRNAFLKIRAGGKDILPELFQKAGIIENPLELLEPVKKVSFLKKKLLFAYDNKIKLLFLLLILIYHKEILSFLGSKFTKTKFFKTFNECLIRVLQTQERRKRIEIYKKDVMLLWADLESLTDDQKKGLVRSISQCIEYYTQMKDTSVNSQNYLEFVFKLFNILKQNPNIILPNGQSLLESLGLKDISHADFVSLIYDSNLFDEKLAVQQFLASYLSVPYPLRSPWYHPSHWLWKELNDLEQL